MKYFVYNKRTEKFLKKIKEGTYQETFDMHKAHLFTKREADEIASLINEGANKNFKPFVASDIFINEMNEIISDEKYISRDIEGAELLEETPEDLIKELHRDIKKLKFKMFMKKIGNVFVAIAMGMWVILMFAWFTAFVYGIFS